MIHKIVSHILFTLYTALFLNCFHLEYIYIIFTPYNLHRFLQENSPLIQNASQIEILYSEICFSYIFNPP